MNAGSGGYSVVRVASCQTAVHRLAFALARGAVPAGRVVRQTCRSRSCVNLAYSVLATRAETLLATRAAKPVRHNNGTETHCKQGHAFPPENTCIGSGQRRCRICQNALNAAHRLRKATQAN